MSHVCVGRGVGAIGVWGLIAAAAGAQPVVYQVDPARSSMSVTIEIQSALGNRSDTDSSPIQGFLYLGVDDEMSPMSAYSYDLEFLLSNTLNFAWSWGFLGSASATMSDAGMLDAAPGTPKGPGAFVGPSFSVADVPVLLQGMFDGSYNFVGIGSGGSSGDLADQPAQATTIDGELVFAGTQGEVSTTVEFSGSFPLDGGVGTVVVNGSATVVAVGTLRTCPADYAEPMGVLNFFDISAFVNQYLVHDPAADFAVDGVFNFFDIQGFVNAFNSGCD